MNFKPIEKPEKLNRERLKARRERIRNKIIRRIEIPLLQMINFKNFVIAKFV